MFFNKFTRSILLVSAAAVVLTSCGSENILSEGKKQDNAIFLNEKSEKKVITDIKASNIVIATAKPTKTAIPTPTVKIEKTEKVQLGAVIQKNDNIYIYKEQTGEISEIGNSDEAKQFIGLSPLKDKFAFSYGFESEENVQPRKIGIYNLKTGELTELKLDENVSQIMEIYWSGNNTIMAVGHINPSANIYQCFDAENGKTVFVNPVSILYDVSRDGRKLIYYFTQHFGEHQLPGIRITGIQNNADSENWAEEPLYRVSQADDEINFVKFYDEDKKIIFCEYIAKEKRSYVKFADIKNNSISVTKIIPLAYKLSDTAECRYFEELSKLFLISDDISEKKTDQTSYFLNILDFSDASKTGVKSIAMESELYKSHKFDIRIEKGRIYIDDTVTETFPGTKTTYVLDGEKLNSQEQQNGELNGDSEKMNGALEKFFGDTYGQTIIYFKEG